MTGYLTRFESEDLLAKRWHLDADGAPVKEAAAQMTNGTYEALSFTTAQELAAIWGSTTTRQALSSSLPHGVKL